MRPVCGRRVTVRFLSFPRAGTGVCEIEISHMGKNNENPNLVCEKFCYIL